MKASKQKTSNMMARLALPKSRPLWLNQYLKGKKRKKTTSGGRQQLITMYKEMGAKIIKASTARRSKRKKGILENRKSLSTPLIQTVLFLWSATGNPSWTMKTVNVGIGISSTPSTDLHQTWHCCLHKAVDNVQFPTKFSLEGKS